MQLARAAAARTLADWAAPEPSPAPHRPAPAASYKPTDPAILFTRFAAVARACVASRPASPPAPRPPNAAPTPAAPPSTTPSPAPSKTTPTAPPSCAHPNPSAAPPRAPDPRATSPP
jgi:hypothetical protein